MSMNHQHLPEVRQASARKTRYMIQVTLLCCLQFVLQMVPFLGFIPLGPINATTLHLPVIVAGSLLGVKAGAIVGLCFGVISMSRATLIPGLTSFVFSPLVPGGNVFSIIVAILPRVLLGVFAALLYKGLRQGRTRRIAAGATGLIATVLHTGMVLGGIYLFFGTSFSQAQGISFHALVPFLLGIVATSGVAEALVALVVNTVLLRVLEPLVKR